MQTQQRTLLSNRETRNECVFNILLKLNKEIELYVFGNGVHVVRVKVISRMWKIEERHARVEQRQALCMRRGSWGPRNVGSGSKVSQLSYT